MAPLLQSRQDPAQTLHLLMATTLHQRGCQCCRNSCVEPSVVQGHRQISQGFFPILVLLPGLSVMAQAVLPGTTLSPAAEGPWWWWHAGKRLVTGMTRCWHCHCLGTQRQLPLTCPAAAQSELPAELRWALSSLHRLINPDLQKKAADWGPLNRLSRLLICLH